MRALVTGATGFVGANIVAALTARGVAVRILRRPTSRLDALEGLSYEEIAESMNCPIGTVRSRIFRAREAIANELRPLLDTHKDKRW